MESPETSSAFTPSPVPDYLYRNPVGEGIDYAPGVTADYIMDTLDELTDYGLMYAAVGDASSCRHRRRSTGLSWRACPPLI